MSFINEVKKDNVIYDIQDKRLTVSAADAGKMVAVNEQGELTLVDAPSGGTKLYEHHITLKSSTKWQQYVLILATNKRIDTELSSGTKVKIVSGAAYGYGPGTNAEKGVAANEISISSSIQIGYVDFSSGTAGTSAFTPSDVDSYTITEI